MATGELTEPARVRRLETTVYGDKVAIPPIPGLLDVVNRHTRQIYGDETEDIKGLLPRTSRLEMKFSELAEKYNDLSDGKKAVLQLLAMAAPTLIGIGTLITALVTAYVVIARGA